MVRCKHDRSLAHTGMTADSETAAPSGNLIVKDPTLYDPTFGPTSLERHLRKSDFRDFPALTTTAIRQTQVEAAVEMARTGLAGLSLQKSDHAGRTIFRLKHLPSELVLRKAEQNLRKITYAKQSNRLDIIRRLRLLCEEGLPYCIAKFDIKSFYQSIDHQALKVMFSRRLSTAPGTRNVLNGFVDQCMYQGIQGVPAGLAISAAIGEMYMQDFDAAIRTKLSTVLSARYVDDIILVLPPAKNVKSLRKDVASLLPEGLVLNERKTKILQFHGTPQKPANLAHQFEYLGFHFQVSDIFKDRPFKRNLILDIAPTKVKKRKARIIKSLIQFLGDGKFEDLRDRFRLISCSYKFVDQQKSRVRSAGIFHTYGLIDVPSNALAELDKFTARMLLSSIGKLAPQLSIALTRSQKRELLSLTFTDAFARKVHFHYPPERLNFLTECWKYA